MPNLPKLAGPKLAFQPAGLDERQNSFPFKCLMFFTFVLFMAPQLMFPVLQPLSLAKTSAGFAIAAYVLNRLSRGVPFTVMTPEVRLIFCLVVLAVISIPISLWPGGSWNTLFDLFLKSVLIFFLIANVVDTVERMKILIGSMALWGAVMSVVGIRDYAAGALVGQGIRIAGYESPLAMNPNDFALTLNVILGLTFGVFLGSTGAMRRLLLVGAMGLFAAGVVVSFSRGGFLGLAVIAMLLLARLLRKRGPTALLVLVALLLLAPFILPEGYSTRLYSVYDTSADPTGSATARWELMKHAVRVMLSRPFGVGLGMNTLGLREAGLNTWSHVHSAPLQIGTDLGFPGLIVFLLLIYRLIQGLRRSLVHIDGFPHLRSLHGLGYGVWLSLVGFLATAMFGPVAYHFYLYYIVGFAVAFQVMAETLIPRPHHQAGAMPGHA